MSSTNEREGYRSINNGHLGVYTLCSGPDPRGPIPGERLIIVIYDNDDSVARRLEQVKGDYIDPGYVDFFNSFHCRPDVSSYHIIDIDKDGNKIIMATHTTSYETYWWLKENVPKWVQQHGIEQRK